MPPIGHDDTQSLIHATALCNMLLETLERMSEPIASEEFIAVLREFCDHAHSQLSAAAAT
jgi:hypothetical protein